LNVPFRRTVVTSSYVADRAVVWAWYPEWKDRVASVWLWFERVRIESGRIVLHVEVMQPVKVAQHESGPESGGTPFTRVAVDLYGASFKSTMRGKQVTIMFKIMYAHLESFG